MIGPVRFLELKTIARSGPRYLEFRNISWYCESFPAGMWTTDTPLPALSRTPSSTLTAWNGRVCELPPPPDTAGSAFGPTTTMVLILARSRGNRFLSFFNRTMLARATSTGADAS